jgi:DNA polymerase III subunit beta
VSGAEPGITTLPARKLTDIVRELPDGTVITITLDKTHAVLKTATSRFTLAFLSPKDFPRVAMTDPRVERTLVLDAKQLRALMDRSMHAMGKDDARVFLNALFLEIREHRLHCVGSDGHRLAVASLPMPPGTCDVQALISRKASTELFALLQGIEGEIALELSARHLRVSLPDTVYITSLIEAKFPDYRSVIPLYSGEPILVKRMALLEAVERADIMNENGRRSVALTITPNTLKVTSDNRQEDNATDAIDAQTKIPELQVGCNATYLLEALRATPDEDVCMCMRDHNTSIVMTPVKDADSLMQVIMPVRL